MYNRGMNLKEVNAPVHLYNECDPFAADWLEGLINGEGKGEETMKRVIFKTPVNFGLDGRTVVELPRGARALSLQVQRGVPCVWWICDPDAPRETRALVVRGTGEPFSLLSASLYVGTWQDGNYVWHLFEV